MQRAIHEYVTLAQRLQPPADVNANAREASQAGVEATRLLLSLNVVVRNGGGMNGMEMARAVAISGQANQVPRQIAQILEDRVREWRRLDGEMTSKEDGGAGSPMLRLLRDLASQQFVVSVLAPADALPFGKCDANDLVETLRMQMKTEILMLRDEDEQSGTASANVLALLRAIKNCPDRNCTLRQVEECEIELEGIVKEWLHSVSPWVLSSLHLASLGNVEVEIRANFVLAPVAEAPTSAWTALHGSMRKLRLRHLVPLNSIHPTLLMGCPLRVVATNASFVKVNALHRFLRADGCGALISCKSMDVTSFYLMTAAPAISSATFLLLYRLASSEEILLPAPSVSETLVHSQEDQADQIAEEIQRLRKLPKQAYNPFHNRSGVFDTPIQRGGQLNVALVPPRAESTTTHTFESARGAATKTRTRPLTTAATASKKKRLL